VHQNAGMLPIGSCIIAFTCALMELLTATHSRRWKIEGSTVERGCWSTAELSLRPLMAEVSL